MSFQKTLRLHRTRIMKQNPDVFNNVSKQTTRYENYIREVMYRNARIEITFQQLKHILVYINHFPNTNLYKKNKIVHTDYIQYHIENFIYRIYSLQDKSLLLINTILQLGLSPKYCSYQKLKNKIKKPSIIFKPKKTGEDLILTLEKDLYKISNILDKYKDKRDLNIHRGHFEYYYEDFLDWHFLNTFCLDKKTKKFIDYHTKEWVLKIRSKFEKDINEVTKNINILLKNLSTLFHSFAEHYRNNGKKS